MAPVVEKVLGWNSAFPRRAANCTQQPKSSVLHAPLANDSCEQAQQQKQLPPVLEEDVAVLKHAADMIRLLTPRCAGVDGTFVPTVPAQRPGPPPTTDVRGISTAAAILLGVDRAAIPACYQPSSDGYEFRCALNKSCAAVCPGIELLLQCSRVRRPAASCCVLHICGAVAAWCMAIGSLHTTELSEVLPWCAATSADRSIRR